MSNKTNGGQSPWIIETFLPHSTGLHFFLDIFPASAQNTPMSQTDTLVPLRPRHSTPVTCNRMLLAVVGVLMFGGAFILSAVGSGMIPIPPEKHPAGAFRAIATWAYKFSSSSQVAGFVQKAADAGYTHIWCFNGWAGPDGSYTNAENAGGILISTIDPYLAPLVMGDYGSQLVRAGHARGMKVIAFDSIFDMYGCKAKKGIDAGGLTWDVGDPRVLTFYDHYSKACKAGGFDGFLLDEVGYPGTKAPALTALFARTVARSGFSPAQIWVSMRFVSSPCYDLARWKEMGLSFSPWTIYDNGRQTNPNYPLPPELIRIRNSVVVWVYGGYGIARNIAISQFQTAKDQGANGGGYWVANPDGTFTAWDWTGVYAQLIRKVFPDIS